MTVEYDTVSPYRAFVATTAADQIVAAVNTQVIATAAQRVADRAGEAGASLPPELDPEVIAAPTRASVTDLAPSAPNIVAFYGIMVLALIVQHTAITVSALSMLHDRRRGMFDLFRMSPIAQRRPAGRQVRRLRPARARSSPSRSWRCSCSASACRSWPAPGVVVGAVALLVLASIGIGIVVALVSDTDRQAVQVALLVLLASVFFSGLALDLDQFSGPGARGERACCRSRRRAPCSRTSCCAARRTSRGGLSCWRRWRSVSPWPDGSSSGASCIGRHEHPESSRPGVVRPRSGGERSRARTGQGPSRPGRCRPTAPRPGRSSSWLPRTTASAAALRRATELAAKRGEPLILYDWDAPSLLSEPLPTWWSSEGWDQQFPDRLDADQLETAGRGAIAAQVTQARESGVEAFGWLPSDHGPRALARVRRRPSGVDRRRAA